MGELLVRFLVGGVVVGLFATLGDILRPKSFAGLFGAAPSIALATIGLTIHHDGKAFAALEARSMMLGALAFYVYAAATSWVLRRYKVANSRCDNCLDAGLVLGVLRIVVPDHGKIRNDRSQVFIAQGDERLASMLSASYLAELVRSLPV